MNKKNIKILFSILIILSAVCIYYFGVNSNQVADIPNLSPRTSNGEPSSEYINTLRSVEKLRAEIRKNPKVTKYYVELAQIFLQESRITGRHHEYIPKAKLMLEDALNIDPHNFNAAITKASMLMTLHQFREADQLVNSVIDQDSYNAFAYGVLVDANVELGNYQKAVQYCDKMLSLRPDLRSYARASYLRELFGEDNAAVKAMKMACDAGMYGKEERAWTLYNLGGLFLREGKIDTAEYIFKGILQERPNYAFALSGLAQVDCARKNYPEAIELLVKASQFNPNHLFVQQLADIYMLLGQKESEDQIDQKVLAAFELHKIDGYDIHYEYAKFCSDHNIHLKKALEHAKEEYTIRPNNIDALDTYAWTLYKNGKADEAIPFIEKAMRIGTNRSTLHYHAAVIYHAANQDKKAAYYLELSLKEDPYVDPLYVDNAHKLFSSLEKIASLK